MNGFDRITVAIIGMFVVMFGYSLSRQDMLWLRCSQFVTAVGVDNGSFVFVRSTSAVNFAKIEWEGVMAPKFERHVADRSAFGWWFRVNSWPTARLKWFSIPIWLLIVLSAGGSLVLRRFLLQKHS
ncbi:MAG: hypothetical protein AAGH89_04480 [Verrucomicrobiota bacterium]